MPNLLERILEEMLIDAKRETPITPRLLHDGDVAHVKRWLADGRGADIAEKIFPGIDYRGMFFFTMIVLRAREDAEETDRLNREFPTLDRRGKELAPDERKRAARMLVDNELSLPEFAALNAQIEWVEAGQDDALDPLLSVRADKNGSRKKTLFCRILSHIFAKGSRKHYAEIAVLCEIAFKHKDFTIEMVRSACDAGQRDRRRHRPR